MNILSQLVSKLVENVQNRPLKYGRDFTVEPLRIGHKKKRN